MSDIDDAWNVVLTGQASDEDNKDAALSLFSTIMSDYSPYWKKDICYMVGLKLIEYSRTMKKEKSHD